MKPLDNLRVLDITYYLPGPFSTMRLAEMGADVMKIEPPGGDPAFS
ncbi:MAG TPA: CoA transferase, partial [Paenisporosarcina sp.]|nr:CoA transferase [Paenisporosarcina sp.]